MAEDNPKTSAAKKPAAKKAAKKPAAKKPAAKKAAKKPAAKKAAKKPAAKKPAAKKPAAKKPAAKKPAAKKPAAKKPAAKKPAAKKPATQSEPKSPLHVMQYDPGRYRVIVAAYECARMNALLDGNATIEMWALSTESSGTVQPYREVSTTPTAMESLYGGRSESEAVFLASIPYTYNYVRVPIQFNPTFGWTGAGTTPTGNPQLFAQAVYSVQQGGVEVGQLLIENTQDGCNQYWFLYQVAQGSTGVYTWPSPSNTDVTTTYAYSGPFSGPYDLGRFASNLPQSTYLKGKESYVASP